MIMLSCGATDAQWCCGASYFGYEHFNLLWPSLIRNSSINGQLSQWSGKFVPVAATDVLTIDYKVIATFFLLEWEVLNYIYSFNQTRELGSKLSR